MSRDVAWRWALGIWALSTLFSTFLRPITPIDETRYLTVAWEMYLAGDPWLPTLNGVPYSDKPPLLFWLINLGWWLFGTNDIWPRVMTAAFGLGVAVLVARTASALRPEDPHIGGRAALAMTATSVWLLFNGAVMFDVMLTFFVLSAIVIILGMRGIGATRQWLMVGVSLGLGVLTKGPVALLHALPLALLAPIWKPSLEGSRPYSWWPWYRGLLLSLFVTVAILSIWLIPAIARGGQAFLDQLVWQQTIDRVATTTHHLRPGWFYLAILPVVLFPWWLMPQFWRRPRLLRVLLSWIIPVLVAFSCFRGKQLHYLFPLIPALAIVIADASAESEPRRLGILEKGAAISVSILLVAYVAIGLRFGEAYDVTPMAKRIHRLQQSGAAVAQFGRYHGQFQFAGRLTEPLSVIVTPEDWQSFKAQHPHGYVVIYSRDQSLSINDAVFTQRFRSQSMSLWRVDTVDTSGLSQRFRMRN